MVHATPQTERAPAGAPRVHAIVYAWPRVQLNALAIARELVGHAHRVSIVDATDDPLEPTEGVEIHAIGGDAYFGAQFKASLDVFDGDVLLHIAADTTTRSWAQVAQRCAARFGAIADLGVWTPRVDWSNWMTDDVVIYRTSDPDLVGVVQTDCIVWGLRGELVSYLKALDYGTIPLGWGVDWAAIAHCYARHWKVLRDASVEVTHKAGSGYDHRAAGEQMRRFLNALGDDEKIQLVLMLSVTGVRPEHLPFDMNVSVGAPALLPTL